MLDINLIRQNPQKVKEGAQNKGVKVEIDLLLEVDKEIRKVITERDETKAAQNKITKRLELGLTNIHGPGPTKTEYREIIESAAEKKAKVEQLEEKLRKLRAQFNELLTQVPNLPFDDVPEGKDERDNVVVKKVSNPPKFSFKPKDYMEIAENLDLIDTKRAAKISGTRFGILKKEAALIEFALVRFAFDLLLKEKFVPVLPPVMLKEEMAQGTGYFEATDRDEAYFIPKDDLFLTGTSEQALVAMHADEVFDEKDLPRRYVGFSTCFRREAGSYGKDTKGILRVHQFDKVEMVSFCKPEDSKKEHQFLLRMQEKLMKPLKIPYQVVQMCTGELGRPAASKYDIESWLPSENRYRETHSTSNCTDFQARRLNIRYRDKSGKLNFLHTLNGTVFSQRPLLMLLENHQQKDGSVKIPIALKKYLGFNQIKWKKK